MTMIATTCCVCGIELKDATSIEKGIGPICRKAYHYEDAYPIPEDRMQHICGLVVRYFVEEDEEFAGRVVDAVCKNDSRKAANLLVYRASAHGGSTAINVAQVLRAIGYAALADRIEDRLAKIVLEESGEMLKVRTPYNPDFVTRVKQIEGRRWDKEEKVWLVPMTAQAKAALWQLLRDVYPGEMAIGPKGPFKVA